MRIAETQNKLLLGIGMVAIVLLHLCNIHNSFFWDTVHFASFQSDFFYRTRFSTLLLPDGIDSGHFPGFALYVATIWNFFGISLANSHLATLPFVIGIVWEMFKLCQRFIPVRFSGFALLLVLSDPSLLSQVTLVSPDIPLLFFFLLGTRAVLDDKRLLLGLATLFLFALSLRGIILSVGLLSLDLYCNVNFKEKTGLLKTLIKKSLAYFPSLLMFTAYFSWHYAAKGWIITHSSSPWAKGFTPVDAKSVLFNIGILGWRLLDFGKFAIWIAFTALLLKYARKIFRESQNRLLVFFTLVLIMVLAADTIWFSNLLAHRYFIPAYLIFSIACARILFSDFVNKKWRGILVSLWIVGIASGNFWIYPTKIAEGWDSTLAHLPYFELRNDAIAYLDEKHIDFSEVQSFFPNTAPIHRIDLNGDNRQFDNFDGNSKYVFFSNVYNASDQDQDAIAKHYIEIKRFAERGVFIVIYKNSNH